MSRPMIDRALAALLRALKSETEPCRLIEMESVPWASATFAGGRHVATLELEGERNCERACALCAKIANFDFALPGHLVADICARCDGPALTLEALILEDR
jgi:hypothetical protein